MFENIDRWMDNAQMIARDIGILIAHLQASGELN